MLQLARKIVAEFIGTFALVFAGCGSVMILERSPGTIPPLAVPIVFGVVVTCMIYAFASISGAHFNPAVTLAFSVTKRFPTRNVPAYWLAQLTAGFAAMFALHFILPKGTSYGATVPLVETLPALGIEAALSFSLMWVVLASDKKIAAISIGGIVAICAFIGGPYTGASMNPARSLGPAVFENTLPSMWIYVVGPFVGAVFAGVVYEWFQREQ